MSPLASAILEVIRSALDRSDKLDAAEAELVFSTLVADLRARRPMSVAPLSVLAAPTEPIRDPRHA